MASFPAWMSTCWCRSGTDSCSGADAGGGARAGREEKSYRWNVEMHRYF